MGSMVNSQPGADRVRFFEDFLGKAGDATRLPLVEVDTSAAGSPTLDYVTNAAGGQFVLTLAANDEVETLTVHGQDNLNWNPAKHPVIEIRAKISAQLTSVQRVVLGFASALNATLDSIASNLWFRFEGANLNVLIEGDDGTTDTNDIDTEIDWVADTFHTFTIDATDLTAVRFSVDGKESARRISVSALTAALPLQPYVCLQKDSGTAETSLTIDYILVEQDR